MNLDRVLTGVRPTGPLHLGHKVGALDNWVSLQNSSKYECFFLIADLQALTTHSKSPELIKTSIHEVILDWLAVGLNPSLEEVNFVLQSSILERHELSLLLQMITPYKWIESNPTVKDELKAIKSDMVVGFPSYPVDQAADILMISPIKNKILIPVGEDQAPHIELTRRIAKRFNSIYRKDTLPQCKELIGKTGRLIGIDGNEKMSKSKNNTIQLSDSEKILKQKINKMYTDPNKTHICDKGNTENHVPLKYLRIFYPHQEEVNELQKKYENGQIGDVSIKSLLFETLNDILLPIRIKRSDLKNTININEILYDGNYKTRVIAKKVLKKVKNAMQILDI